MDGCILFSNNIVILWATTTTTTRDRERVRVGVSSFYSEEKERQMTRIFHSSIFELCSPSCLLPFSTWLAAMFFFPKSLQMVIFIVIIIIYRLIFSPSSVQQHKNILRWEEIYHLYFSSRGGSMCTCNCQMDAPDVAICRASFSTHKKKRKKTRFTRRFLVRFIDWTRPISTCYKFPNNFTKLLGKKKHRRERDELSGKKNFK